MKQSLKKLCVDIFKSGAAKSTRTFRRMVASFLLMLILPLLTLLANYVYARQLLQEENLSYQNAVLLQAQKMIDERLQGLQLFAIDISNDSTINAFLSGNSLLGAALNVKVGEISKYMQTYSASYRNLCQSMIYSVNYDFLISAEGSDSSASEKIIRLDSAQLNSMLQNRLQDKKLYCQYEFFQDANKNGALVMLHSVPLWSTGRQTTGVICLLINTDELFNNINTIDELEPGIVCLLDDNNQPVATVGNVELLNSLDIALSGEEGFIELDNSPYTLTTAPSSINGWKYVSIQPEHLALAKLQTTQVLSSIMFVLVLVIGVFCAYVLSRRNYKPVENLMQALRKQSVILKEHANDDENEFHLIERSVTDIAKSMVTVQVALHEELPRIQEIILMQLLKNAVIDYSSFKNTLADMGVLLPFDKFSVAVVRLVMSGRLSIEDQAISNVVIKEQLMRLIPHEIAYTTVTPQSDILVVILNSNMPSFEDIIKRSLLMLLEHMRDDFTQMLSICVSKTVQEIEKVPHAYYTAIQSQNPNPNGGLFFLPEHSQPWRIEQSLEEISSLLQNYITTANTQSALSLIREKTSVNIKGKNLELHYVRGYFISLLNMVMNSYVIEDNSILNINGTDPLQLLFMEETLPQLEATIETVVIRLCEQVQLNQKGHASQLITQILAFIKDEYANSELTLSFVADHYYITPSYLSTFFKDNVGDTFLNYLTRLRIDKSKELIRTTNLSMGDIATQVGYASGNTFTRIFKKSEHITPTQYREGSQ